MIEITVTNWDNIKLMIEIQLLIEIPVTNWYTVTNLDTSY